jgi:hypothetical protein
MRAVVVSIPKVRGMRMDTPAAGPIPGSTPMSVPIKQPIKQKKRFCQDRAI